MATVYQFWNGPSVLRLVHEGATLITGEGEDAVVQRFPGAEAAREHLERLLQNRRRSGYRIETSATELPPGQFELAELAEHVAWDEANRRMIVTFKSALAARDLAPAILDCAAATRPIYLRVACDPGSPGAAFAAALRATTLPTVRRFIFDTDFQTLTRQRSNTIGDLADVFAGLPALESAFLSGELLLRPCDHATLRELWLLGDPLLPSTVSALGRCTFPALTRIGLALRSDHDDGPEAPAARALRTLTAPSLRTVDVASIADIPAFLALLTPLPPHWTELHLTGSIADEDALLAVLELHAPALSRLTRLALPLCDELSGDADERARKLLPNLIDSEELSDPFLPATYESW